MAWRRTSTWASRLDPACALHAPSFGGANNAHSGAPRVARCRTCATHMVHHVHLPGLHDLSSRSHRPGGRGRAFVGYSRRTSCGTLLWSHTAHPRSPP
jgi:hypothetical protein